MRIFLFGAYGGWTCKGAFIAGLHNYFS